MDPAVFRVRLTILASMSVSLLICILLALSVGMAQEPSPPTPTPKKTVQPVTPKTATPAQPQPSDVTSRALKTPNCEVLEAITCSVHWVAKFDPAMGYFVNKFEPACVVHDLCYRYGHATYGFSRTQCDDKFYDHMKQICDGTSLAANIFTAGGAEVTCNGAALAFYRAVQNVGAGPYKGKGESKYCPYAGAQENAHVTLINPDGTMGRLVDRFIWSNGWSVVRSYTVTSQPYLFFLKNISGSVHLYTPRMLDSNDPLTHVLGPRIASYDWADGLFLNLKSGWTIAEPYEINGQTYFIFQRTDSGQASITSMNPDGTVGAYVAKYDWGSGWTHVRHFSTPAGNFLLFLKSGDGTVHISKLNPDGNLGARVVEYKWTSGWVPELWSSGDNTYLFTYKPENGMTHINKMNTDGTVGPSVAKYDWSSGWDTATFYNVGGATYLLMLKSSNGMASVSFMNPDGTLGKNVAKYDWGSGWTSAVFYKVNNTPYMLFVKARTGGYTSLP